MLCLIAAHVVFHAPQAPIPLLVSFKILRNFKFEDHAADVTNTGNITTISSLYLFLFLSLFLFLFSFISSVQIIDTV